MRVICELLGIPARYGERLLGLSDEILVMLDPGSGTGTAEAREARATRGAAAMAELEAMCAAIFTARLKRPRDDFSPVCFENRLLAPRTCSDSV
jgi:cytochrome P450